ncbi:MAG: polysaccharide deacetylase family protein [Pseudomonadota bacterium]
MNAFDLFRKQLDIFAAEGRRLQLWLRDDDAVEPTEQLDRLLSIMNKHSVPGLLAVIPAQATSALAARLAVEPLAFVAPHGWAHENYQPDGVKKSEFGSGRPADAIASDLTRGRKAIETGFARRFLPVFVPPWNRIADTAISALPAAGFAAVSLFGQEKPGPLPQVNTHVDLIDWRGTRGGRATEPLLDDVRAWAETETPVIGLLTHHLVHDAAAWDFLEQFLAVTSGHSAVDWVSPSALLSAATARL